jgi:hypothetical protein
MLLLGPSAALLVPQVTTIDAGGLWVQDYLLFKFSSFGTGIIVGGRIRLRKEGGALLLLLLRSPCTQEEVRM